MLLPAIFVPSIVPQGGCWPPGLAISLIEIGIAIEFDYPFNGMGAEVQALKGRGRVHSAGIGVRLAPEGGGRSTISAKVNVEMRALPVQGE